MFRTNRVVLFTALLGLAAGSPSFGGLEGEGEEGDVKRIKGDSQAAARLALTARSRSLAAAAFGEFLRCVDDPGSASSLETMIDFADGRGRYSRAALLVAYTSDTASPGKINTIVKGLLEERDSDAEYLAALMLATSSLKSYLGDTEVPGGGGKRRKRRRRNKKAVKLSVPGSLLNVRDNVTVKLAVLAAAYGRNGGVKEAVDGLVAADAGIQGARLLYDAIMGNAVSGDRIEGVFRLAEAERAGIERASPELMEMSVDVPGMCSACEALGVIGEEKYVSFLHDALDNRDIRVRIEAVRAIGKIGSVSSLRFLAGKLLDCDWPVLVEVAHILGEIPDSRSVPFLLRRLERETGRFRLDLVHALSSIAGAPKGKTAAEWNDWWNENRDDFEVDRNATRAYRNIRKAQHARVPAFGYFYGLSICSDRFSYVVDSSASMRGDRMKSLRQNLVESIDRLADHVCYNIVDFGGDVVSMDDELVSSKRIGIRRAESMPLTWGTRSFDALDRAMAFPGVDTVYFLSDGAPVRGQLGSWGEIIPAISILTRYRPVAVHAVGFKVGEKNLSQMRWMAEQNFGTCESVF